MEDKLELRHLAPYLPYGLAVTQTTQENSFVIDGIRKVKDYYVVIAHNDDGSFFERGMNYVKPLLRPLSDLTKEIEHNGEIIIPANWLHNHYSNTPNWFEHSEQWIKDKDDLRDTICEYCVVQKLIEWHFDVWGLIENGLAIDKTSM